MTKRQMFFAWAKTVSTKPIIFVYSYNDPWTGSAIDKDAISTVLGL